MYMLGAPAIADCCSVRPNTWLQHADLDSTTDHAKKWTDNSSVYPQG